MGKFTRGLAIYRLVAALLLAFVFLNGASERDAAALNSIPYKMNFQGQLTGSNGLIVPNGVYNMRFQLFDASTGGTALWTSTRLVSAGNAVQVTNGRFYVQLGRIVVLDPSLFNTNSNNLYLEVELPSPGSATSTSPVWSEGPMTPRNQVLSSAYSFNADKLDGLDGDDFAKIGANNTFSGSQMFNGGSLTIGGAANTSKFNVSNLFNVDTTNGTVSIGQPDASATLLVLDSKTTSGDPNGTNGAMYYNSSAGKFRCYEAGSWRDCVPRTIRGQFYDSAGGTDVNNSSLTAVPWNTETRKDSGITHSNSVNPSRIYIDNPGWYEISYQINGQNQTNNRNTAHCRIRWNGTVFNEPGGSYSYSRDLTNAEATNSASVLVNVTGPNQYYEILCQQAGTAGAQPTIAGQSWTKVESAD